ncbi:MAG: MG2 domain-containing protein, partial [Bacteroidota bacterium]|nr:MG2 domain-containing protein [Bacteroidota bacterium]
NIQKTDKQVVGQFTVSNLAYFARTIKKDVIDLYAVDRSSGHPQKGVMVRLYKEDGYGSNAHYSQLDSCTTDEKGYCSFNTSNSYGIFVNLQKENDTFFPLNAISTHLRAEYREENSNSRMALFTDRAIYRPGQTVYFKGIAWQAGKDSSGVIPGREYTISLRDANYQEVERKFLKTNEFGSFNGSFVLPKGRLNGHFSLRSEDLGIVSFRVEEYKRPSFEVKFDSIKGTPSFGDKLRLSGNVKSYADFAITGASVKYRIVRRPHWLMRWNGISEDEIANGTLKTDEKGDFSVTFVPEKQKTVPFGYQEIYTYTISATVTDSNGETQENETTFSVGEISMSLTANTQDNIDKSQPFDIEVKAQNLNDTPVRTTIHYTLSRLNPESLYSEKIKKENLRDIEKTLMNGSLETGKENKIHIQHPENWNSGKYLLTLTAKDEQGRPVKTEKPFILYSPEDKQLPVKSYCWSQNIKTVCEPGEKAEILFGTSAPDTKVLYELMDGNTILDSKWLDFNNELKRLSIPFKKDWAQGVTLQLTFIKDNQYFTKEIKISHKDKSKQLSPKFSTFRSKLQPGQKEEWRVTIPELKTNKKQAEIMATMYDASLDVFAPLNWRFNPIYLTYPRYSPTWNVQIGGTNNNNTYYLNGKIIESPDFIFDNFDNILNSLFVKYPVNVRTKSIYKPRIVEEAKSGTFRIITDTTMVTRDFGKQVVMMEPVCEASSSQNNVTVVGYATTKQANNSTVQPRKNFAETAFFYPQLRTDENGEVSFSFTVPESLTRWNVMGLAHTKDLYFGQWSAQTVTQKQFMVQPNLPR